MVRTLYYMPPRGLPHDPPLLAGILAVEQASAGVLSSPLSVLPLPPCTKTAVMGRALAARDVVPAARLPHHARCGQPLLLLLLL
jgi:hypothetical protein